MDASQLRPGLRINSSIALGMQRKYQIDEAQGPTSGGYDASVEPTWCKRDRPSSV